MTSRKHRAEVTILLAGMGIISLGRSVRPDDPAIFIIHALIEAGLISAIAAGLKLSDSNRRL